MKKLPLFPASIVGSIPRPLVVRELIEMAQWDETDANTMDAAVAEITGIPAERCAEVLGAYLDQILACAADSQLAQGVPDLLCVRRSFIGKG